MPSTPWKKASASRMVRFVGLNCLCSAVLIFVCFQLDRSRDYDIAQAWLAFIANLNLIIAGVLLIYIIFKITRRQQERYAFTSAPHEIPPRAP